jgi:hypothetical protein
MRRSGAGVISMRSSFRPIRRQGFLAAHVRHARPSGTAGALRCFEAITSDGLQPSQSIQAAVMLLGIGWSKAQAIMRRVVARGLERRSLDNIMHVGIGDWSFGKGQDYLPLMTHTDQSRAPDVTLDRTMESADALWKTLSRKQRRRVKAVRTDMWQAYETSTGANAPTALSPQ